MIQPVAADAPSTITAAVTTVKNLRRLAERPASHPLDQGLIHTQGWASRATLSLVIAKCAQSEFDGVFLGFQAGGESLLEVSDLRGGQLCGSLTLLRLLLRLRRL
jgi:hypothetical protein